MLTEVSIVFELLIGGPNQSHKVNFKEPPFRGKRISRNFFFSSVNSFSENFLRFSKEKSQKEQSFSPPSDTSFGLRRPTSIEGKGDGASCDHLRKSFLADFPDFFRRNLRRKELGFRRLQTSLAFVFRAPSTEGTRNMECADSRSRPFCAQSSNVSLSPQMQYVTNCDFSPIMIFSRARPGVSFLWIRRVSSADAPWTRPISSPRDRTENRHAARLDVRR